MSSACRSKSAKPLRGLSKKSLGSVVEPAGLGAGDMARGVGRLAGRASEGAMFWVSTQLALLHSPVTS